MLGVETMRVFGRIRPPVLDSLEGQKALDPAVSVRVQIDAIGYRNTMQFEPYASHRTGYVVASCHYPSRGLRGSVPSSQSASHYLSVLRRLACHIFGLIEQNNVSKGECFVA